MVKKTFSDIDIEFMKDAIQLAEKGRGYVSPNPLVGCVIIDKKGNKIGKGYHQMFGKAHAEVNALKSVKDKDALKGATVYVTLEPCSHHGKTPPCCEALGALPIKRVVIALEDPNPKVNGRGIAYLKNRGIEVEIGCCKKEAEVQNESFLHVFHHHRPLIVLKMAQTADGFMAASDGESKWISGETSRALVHKWRAQYDAVMVGRNTALIDNPKLTVRHVKGRQPFRIVLDANLELPKELNLFTDEFEEKTFRITSNKAAFDELADPMLKMLTQNYFRGHTLLVPEKEGHINLDYLFRELLQHNIHSILIEAGPQLASALIRDNLVDKLELFIAPKLLGSGARAIQNIGIQRMSEVKQFRKSEWTKIGEDMLLTAWL